MNHQRLRCYEVLLGVAKRLPGIFSKIPKGHSYLTDQLYRALTSAILNLSEGNGRTSHKERARFFDISLASISESHSAIDIMESFRIIPQQTGYELKSQLQLAYAMIRKLRSVA